ncbi:hypothetical protein [Microbacterium sp. GXS0129]|uniref:hypothetical protein n=1 Tax=Microbacterium sp. GXS0129 TaxID=3377836 RepID=UPI00383AE6DA
MMRIGTLHRGSDDLLTRTFDEPYYLDTRRIDASVSTTRAARYRATHDVLVHRQLGANLVLNLGTGHWFVLDSLAADVLRSIADQWVTAEEVTNLLGVGSVEAIGLEATLSELADEALLERCDR